MIGRNGSGAGAGFVYRMGSGTDETIRPTKGERMSASARADMSAHDVCTHCYLYFHYNWGYEYPLSWNVDRYGETVNSWAEQGYRVHDGVDRHTDTDTGYTVFSKQPCETCGDHLAGERYRLLVG